jgi:hypothetical protein
MRLPTNDAWNLTVQHQLPGEIAVEAAYIGNTGTHVFAGFGGDYDFNQALSGHGWKNHEHLPARDHASVAVRVARGILI